MKHTIMAQRLKQLLQEREMSVSELARKSGVVDNTIRQLTLGNSKEPRFGLGLALAKALGVHPEELLHVPEEEPKEVPKETLVDRMDKLEAAVALQGSRQTTETLVDRMDRMEREHASSLARFEAVVLKMLQAQGLHQKELEELQKVVRPGAATRRGGKPPLQVGRAMRKA
jgi:transcriptional regulator with XRE-family HTH domain